MSATVTPTGGVTVAAAEAPAAGGAAAGGRSGAASGMQLERPKAAWGGGAWVSFAAIDSLFAVAAECLYQFLWHSFWPGSECML